MPNTINSDAANHIREVTRIHDAALDFITFIEKVKSNVGSDYSDVFNVPSRATNLIAQKTKFDALSIPSDVIKSLLENNHGYSTWTTTHTADFNAIFSKAEAFRGVVEANINEFPATFNALHQLKYVTASQGVQDALVAQIDDILTSIV